ncbi:MAG TPA: TetR/AcrR family transcriptional regulator [Actinocrinis sp.]|nr:TetR/AcrR family transcriptional regulator [Actinocrinis sp.]
MPEVAAAPKPPSPAGSGTPDVGPVRRRPVQRRSLERFERMLDACAQLLDEVGYDELTTSQVAKRARVPIGTLYQFFDGKQALARALARRNLDLFLERLHARFAAAPAVETWADAASVVVSEFVAMKRDVPGFAVVDFGDARAGKEFMLDAEREVENNWLVADRLKQLGVEDLGLEDGPDVDRALLVAVEGADSVLRLAFRYNRDGDPGLIAEADLLLRGYLSSRLPGPPDETDQ